jgi:nicotinate-nucleotide adenylyltransferase
MTKLPLVGIYGGTFDPIHYGHLRVAEELVETIGFDRFYFVPAGEPRLREAPIASKHHRAEMVAFSIQNNARFVLDDREIRRSGMSTTVESLREYHTEYGENSVYCFIMGADTFLKIHRWHLWEELFQLCHLVIVDRPGSMCLTDRRNFPKEIKNACLSRWTADSGDLTRQCNGKIYIAQTTLLDISATRIRKLVATNKSIRYLLPDAVLNYIKTHHLYSGDNGFKKIG